MPPLADTLAQLIGREMTLLLIEQYGGTRVFVPRTRAQGATARKLALALSSSAEAALVEEFGGTTIEVPLCKAWRAVQYRAAGLTHREIARRLGCNERRVRGYLAETDDDTAQLSLFE